MRWLLLKKQISKLLSLDGSEGKKYCATQIENRIIVRRRLPKCDFWGSLEWDQIRIANKFLQSPCAMDSSSKHMLELLNPIDFFNFLNVELLAKFSYRLSALTVLQWMNAQTIDMRAFAKQITIHEMASNIIALPQ